MRHPLIRAVALALTLLTLTSLLTGCKGNPRLAATEASQMNDTAYTIGVPSGSAAVDAVESVLPKAKMKYYSSLSDAYLAVQQGKMDAFAFDRHLLGFAVTNGLTSVRVLPGDVGTAVDVAIGISRKSDIPDLQQKINDCLAQLEADGTLDDMFQRWVLNADDTMPNVPKPEHPGMTLKVGTSGLTQPFSYYRGNELTGYDLELAERLALAMNANLEIKVYDYNGFPAATEAGSIDCVLANLNATPEFGETMDFSTPLYQTQTALLVKDDGTTAEASNAPLETANYGVVMGSTGESYLLEHYPEAKRSTFASDADTFAALEAKKVDYVLSAYTFCQNAVETNSKLAIYKENMTDQEAALAVAKDNPKLLEQINGVIEQFQKDGTLDEIHKRWMDAQRNYTPADIPIAQGKNGVLRVAATGEQEPFGFVLDGKLQGLDCELVERIAFELDMTVEYHTMSFSGLIAALSSGKVDVICSAMAVTAERLESVNFTIPYLNNPLSIVCRKSDLKDILPSQVSKDISRAQVENSRIGVMTGSVAEIYIEKTYPNAKISTYTAIPDAFLALSDGKVNYVMTAYTTAATAIRNNDAFYIYQDNVEKDQIACGVLKGNEALRDQIDAVLTAFKEDGTLDQIIANWTTPGKDYVLEEVPVASGKNGVLRVAISADREPMCFVWDNAYRGLDCELARRIAYALDMKVEFQNMQFNSLIAALQGSKVDVILSNLIMTDERAEQINFTQSYFENPQVLMACKAGGVVEDTSFWSGFKQSFIRTFVTENRWELVLDGLEVTVLISICSGILGSLLGFGICMLRRSKRRIAALPTAGFIRLIQGTPIVVLLMILYYIVFGKVDVSAVLVAIFGFAVNFGVYASEMMRTGINAVDLGQIEAAYALGFTRAKTFWKITFPQAARHFLPVFKGEFISMVKMTSVVGYIAIQDLTKVSDIIRSRTLEAFFPLIATAVLYFLVANIMTMLLSKLEVSLDPKRRKRTVRGVVMK